MKKITLFAASFLFSFLLFAQNDTTFVTTTQFNLDYFGNFDADVSFPDGSQSYRKIIMTLDLGQYDCDPGTQYCHQWDYDVELQLLTDDGEVYELGRFITPFANSGWYRFGSNWKQPYVFDVTDFYPLLQGDKTVRIRYSGYSGGFTAKIKFAFISGTPEREVVGIKPVYQVIHSYGDSNDPFNDYLPTQSETAPEGTQSAALRIMVTGHGSDNNQCCEFMSHYYDVLLNGNQIAQKDVWRDDCGLNNLYPQGGTWVYDRSNWCPGAKVNPIVHNLPNITAGTDFDLDVQFEDYTGNGEGIYKLSGLIFYYGQHNKTVDAAVEDIIAPTDNPNHYRTNPSGNIPEIVIRNTGDTEISSIDFNYGVNGAENATYTWTGSLAPQKNMTLTLPTLDAMTDLSFSEAEGLQEFQVEIAQVNGQEDDDDSNNLLHSHFTVAPKWPSVITVKMKTNNLSANGYFNANPADASWTITDMEGNEIASRTNANSGTLYNDEVDFTQSGFYKFKITSANCFGLFWWALNQGYPQYQGGYLRILDQNGTSIPMAHYKYSGAGHDDFGCAYVQYFSVNVEDAGVKNPQMPSFSIYPVPARNNLNIDFAKGLDTPYQISLVNMQGRAVYHTTAEKAHTQIPVGGLSSGLYFLNFKTSNGTVHTEKVIVAQ